MHLSARLRGTNALRRIYTLNSRAALRKGGEGLEGMKGGRRGKKEEGRQKKWERRRWEKGE